MGGRRGTVARVLEMSVKREDDGRLARMPGSFLILVQFLCSSFIHLRMWHGNESDEKIKC